MKKSGYNQVLDFKPTLDPYKCESKHTTHMAATPTTVPRRVSI